MIRRHTYWTATLLALIALLGTAAAPAAQPDVTIEQARVRWLPGRLPMAGYMVIHNNGSGPLALTGADSDAFGKVMIHRSVIENGQSKMVHVPKLKIEPGGQATFQPGGLHVMLMQRKRDLRPGDSVDITLRFGDGRSLTRTFKVVPANGG